MKITTNHHWRPVLFGHELSARERKQFDYYDDEEILDCTFFRYGSHVYDLAEFTRVNPDGSLALLGWHGSMADTVWSGTLVRLSEDGEYVMVASAYWG